MQKVDDNNKFSAWEVTQCIYSGVPQGSILGPLLFNIFINDIFSFLTTCDTCNYADDNTHSYIQDFHHVQKYLEKDFEILENWFYENYMVLTPRKRELMGFGKTNENEVFTYREIRLSKITTEKLLGITIDEHLNNSDIVLLFGCLVLLGLTE